MLPRCQTEAGDYTLEIRVRDRAGQVRTRSGLGRLSVLAADHQAPGWTVSQEFESNRNLAVAFTEPVTGRTLDTLSLRRLSGDPATVPGAWQCRDDAGAPADCTTGPVRGATYVATEPAVDGTAYEVVANPEHVLGLTDLAGNPASPGGGGSWLAGS